LRSIGRLIPSDAAVSLYEQMFAFANFLSCGKERAPWT
jgi:hypothetical protein